MTRLFTRLNPLAPPPTPDVSPPGIDVEMVERGDIIDAAWGQAVAADLAELHSLVGTGGGGDPETIRDVVAAALVAGPNVTITPDDAADTITIASTGGGTTDPEVVRDVVGAALTAGPNVTITVNDAGDIITISSTGGGSTDPEVIRDTVAAFLVAGTGISLAHSDPTDTLTINALDGGGGVTDGAKGDITVSGGGTTWTIAANAVTNGKLAAASPNTLKGNATAGTAAPTDLTVSQVKALLALAMSDVTGLVAALNGKQPLSMELSGLTAAGSTADRLPYYTGPGAVALATLTPTARALLDDSSTAQMRTTLDVPQTTLAISTTAPLTGGGDLSTNRTLGVSDFTPTTRGTVPASGGGTTNYLRADGTWQPTGGGGGITTEDAVDAVAAALVQGAFITIVYDDALNTITVSATGLVPTTTAITAGTGLTGGGDLSTNRTIALGNRAANSLMGNNTGSATTPVDLTAAQAKTLLALVKADVGLANVDNTSDANKPVSTAQAAAIATKPNALNGLVAVWKGTQAQYDAIGTKDANTLYAITP
jgi:hypothetical protein